MPADQGPISLITKMHALWELREQTHFWRAMWQGKVLAASIADERNGFIPEAITSIQPLDAGDNAGFQHLAQLVPHKHDAYGMDP